MSQPRTPHSPRQQQGSLSAHRVLRSDPHCSLGHHRHHPALRTQDDLEPATVVENVAVLLWDSTRAGNDILDEVRRDTSTVVATRLENLRHTAGTAPFCRTWPGRVTQAAWLHAINRMLGVQPVTDLRVSLSAGFNLRIVLPGRP